jgi:hypothetical protein
MYIHYIYTYKPYIYIIYIYIYIIYIYIGALQRDMPVLVEALAADYKEDQDELKKLQELQAQISRDFDALSTDLETSGKISW